MDERIEKMKAAFEALYGVFVGFAIDTTALAESGETPLPPAVPRVPSTRN